MTSILFVGFRAMAARHRPSAALIANSTFRSRSKSVSVLHAVSDHPRVQGATIEAGEAVRPGEYFVVGFERRRRPGTTELEDRLAELKIVPVDDGDLPTEILTRLGLGRLRTTFAERLPWASKALTGSSWSDDVRIPRPGRRGRPLFHFAEWAQRYVDVLATNPTSPIAQLASQHHEAPGTIRAWLQRAENEGLLDRSGVGPGVAGGQLTERCRQVLAEG